MTSRSRNDNAIKLNEIPKTSYMNVTPIQKMKQLIMILINKKIRVKLRVNIRELI